MLISYDPDRCLYIIGSTEVAMGLQQWISKETKGQTQIVKPEHFHTLDAGSQCMLGFWTMEYRLAFLQQHMIDQHTWPTYVHDRSFVSDEDLLGRGVVIYPMCYLGNGVRIGDFCAIGQLSSLGHSSSLGGGCVVSPGTVIGGSTKIGNSVSFGQSCSVRDKISICDATQFSMTSSVTKSITQPGFYIGNRLQPSR